MSRTVTQRSCFIGPAVRQPGRAGTIARSMARLRIAIVLVAAVVAPSFSVAQSSPIDPQFQEFANRALATFGLVAVPDDTASILSIKQGSEDENKFRSTQIGGGFVWSDDLPLYLEGYLGLQRYDPRFILNKPAHDLDVRATWYGLAATGGVGWNFQLSQHWAFRPIMNVSLGKITSEVNINSPLRADDAGGDLDFLARGDITAGGLGGTLMLEYQNHQRAYDLDFRLRHTYLKLASIGGSSDLNATARAVATSAWVRARVPIKDWRAFGRPVRSVWQASLASYSGEQGDVLGIDWLAKINAGIEIETQNTKLPMVKRARLMVGYAFNGDYRGYSFGIGISF